MNTPLFRSHQSHPKTAPTVTLPKSELENILRLAGSVAEYAEELLDSGPKELLCGERVIRWDISALWASIDRVRRAHLS